jgi:hypothetical protein
MHTYLLAFIRLQSQHRMSQLGSIIELLVVDCHALSSDPLTLKPMGILSPRKRANARMRGVVGGHFKKLTRHSYLAGLLRLIVLLHMSCSAPIIAYLVAYFPGISSPMAYPSLILNVSSSFEPFQP